MRLHVHGAIFKAVCGETNSKPFLARLPALSELLALLRLVAGSER
jgi:hypothetical protein